MKDLILVLLALTSCIVSAQIVKTVDTLDVERYIGKWYEIARIEAPSQIGCCSEAEYGIINPEKLSVKNYCRKQGKTEIAEGFAFPNPTTSKLGVTFNQFPGRVADYWVIGLDKNYQWAVITNRQKKSFYILSRKETLEKKILDNILTIGRQHGYPVDQLLFREQTCKF